MTMTFPDLISSLIEFPQLGPIRRGVEHSRPESQSHRTTHMRLGDFRHEDDDRFFLLRIELARGRVLLTTDVSDPFDDGELETETDTEEGDVLFSGPLNG